MSTRITPKNSSAVQAALKGRITRTDAKGIVKTVAGRSGTINTKKELAQLKAIRSQYATAFNAEAKKLLDKEISVAAKAVAKEARVPQRPVYYGGGGGGSGS